MTVPRRYVASQVPVSIVLCLTGWFRWGMHGSTNTSDTWHRAHVPSLCPTFTDDYIPIWQAIGRQTVKTAKLKICQELYAIHQDSFRRVWSDWLKQCNVCRAPAAYPHIPGVDEAPCATPYTPPRLVFGGG